MFTMTWIVSRIASNQIRGVAVLDQRAIVRGRDKKPQTQLILTQCPSLGPLALLSTGKGLSANIELAPMYLGGYLCV